MEAYLPPKYLHLHRQYPAEYLVVQFAQMIFLLLSKLPARLLLSICNSRIPIFHLLIFFPDNVLKQGYFVWNTLAVLKNHLFYALHLLCLSYIEFPFPYISHIDIFNVHYYSIPYYDMLVFFFNINTRE